MALGHGFAQKPYKTTDLKVAARKIETIFEVAETEPRVLALAMIEGRSAVLAGTIDSAGSWDSIDPELKQNAVDAACDAAGGMIYAALLLIQSLGGDPAENFSKHLRSDLEWAYANRSKKKNES